MNLLKQECKINGRALLVWTLCVGGLCLGCLFLYDSLGDSVSEMSSVFSEMGAFSQALGMDKVNIGTLEGYYAVEISIMLSLGSAMFAAMLGAGLVAKEEEGHTCEFLNTLPMERGRIIGEKYGAMVLMLAVFHAVCMGMMLTGFACMGDMPDMKNFFGYHMAVFLMCLEIGSLCFLLSTVRRKKPLGEAIGLAVLFYMLDLMCRVVPALEKAKYLTPFYYCSASDIFSGERAEAASWIVGAGITLFSLFGTLLVYGKKDLAS